MSWMTVWVALPDLDVDQLATYFRARHLATQAAPGDRIRVGTTNTDLFRCYPKRAR